MCLDDDDVTPNLIKDQSKSSLSERCARCLAGAELELVHMAAVVSTLVRRRPKAKPRMLCPC